jgi:uncharacterized protein (TIGR00369 family)
MKQINPKHIKALIPLINKSPYFLLLSMTITDIGHGYCKMEMQLDKQKHNNPFGGLHGGVYASAIDSAAYWAVYCSIDENSGLISLDLHIDNLATTSCNKVFVEGKLKRSGRTVCFSEATVTDSNGKLLAYGTSKQLVTNNLQTLNQVILNMGNEPLPPKYSD